MIGAARYFPTRYFASRYFPKVGETEANGAYFAGRYFARRYFAPRYWPGEEQSVVILVSDVDALTMSLHETTIANAAIVATESVAIAVAEFEVPPSAILTEASDVLFVTIDESALGWPTTDDADIVVAEIETFV